MPPAPRRIRAVRPLAALALAVLAVVLPLPALADDGAVDWGVRTADNGNGAARQNFLYALAPGADVADALVIANHDDQPLELQLYAADAYTTEQGQLDVRRPEEASPDAASWIRLDADRVTIPAHGSVEVPFTVRVPANATPGDHLAGILTSLGAPEGAPGISVDRRLGIRVQLRVEGPLDPALVVEDLALSYGQGLLAGGADVSFTVRNTGNVRLSGPQSVALSGPFGIFRADIDGVAALPELLPGESWRVTAHADGVIPALWLGAEVTIAPTPPRGFDTGPLLPLVVASTGIVAVPWTLVALVLLVAGGAVATVLLLRRRRRARRAAEAARVEAAIAAARRERAAS